VGAPDYAVPMVGWRVWHVVEREGALRLRSPLFPTTWLPNRELAAVCRPRAEAAFALLRAGRFGHLPPDVRCGCGIYGGLTPPQATGYLSRFFKPRGDVVVHRVLGTVSLWGTVIVCERGWRAAYAYPAHIYVPVPTRPRRLHPDRVRPSLLPAGEVALALADYGVPVDVVGCSTVGELTEALTAGDAKIDVPNAA
jgi:hypothetical protein